LKRPNSARLARIALAALVVWAAAGVSACDGDGGPIVLPEAAVTSAGVFDAQSRLVRTLWSGETRPAGAITAQWDGLDDDGAPVDQAGSYEVRVLAHDVKYVWEGVIGNTSRDASGEHVHRAFRPINAMAIDPAGAAFYVVGYNELQRAIHRFQVSDPQWPTPLAHDDYRRVFSYVATDGELVYVANISRMGEAGTVHDPTFVIALKVSDGTEYRFPSGRLEMPDNLWGNRWWSVIDYDRASDDSVGLSPFAASGLAVQQRGSFLFVAHAGTNEVRVLDKRSGAMLGRIPVAEPSSLAVASDDALWVLARPGGKPTVVHYRFVAGAWVSDTQVTDGLLNPVAIGVSPVDGTLVVADAGSEQFKAFDASGMPAWVLGQAGGYAALGPDVTFDKFWLSAGPTYVAFQTDGSFWVGDPGNFRNLHFSAQRAYVEQIMYLPHSYSSSVAATDPTRVFDGFLEFKVDYSKPLAQSWTLVQNWGANLEQRFQVTTKGIRSVVALSNGRTYAVMARRPNGSDLVELTAGGRRLTGTHLDLGTKLYADGSLRYQEIKSGSLTVYRRDLQGFDAAGNPQWGEPLPLTGVSGLKERDPYYHSVPLIGGINEATFPVTASDVVVSFTPGKSQGFHLGGMRSGEKGWLWRASPTGLWTLDGGGHVVASDGAYETGRGVHYPASVVMASGHNIVFGYHGEFWNGGQANQWLQYYDNGLFVGQFGRPTYPGPNKTDALPESAGNAFSPELVSVNGQLYLWHNDESVHGGVHRWRIDGADQIKVYGMPITP
jgi:hypothetical protein